MKRFAPTLGAVVFILVALGPARADYAVVRFADGACQIWSNAADTPWGTDWSKIAITPDWSMARAALDDAIQSGACY